jgi:hypothetical protein
MCQADHSSREVLMIVVCDCEASIIRSWPTTVSRDNLVGIAARNRMDCTGIKFRWRQDFPHLSRTVLGLTQPPVQRVPPVFPRGEAGGVWS